MRLCTADIRAFVEVVNRGSVNVVEISADAPALLQLSAGSFSEYLHGCVMPGTEGLSPESIFDCHVCVHQHGVLV